MLIPTKYENLTENPLVLGASLLKILKGRPHQVEQLFQSFNKINLSSDRAQIDLGTYYDVLTFLWLSGCIKINSQNTLYVSK